MSKVNRLNSAHFENNIEYLKSIGNMSISNTDKLFSYFKRLESYKLNTKIRKQAIEYFNSQNRFKSKEDEMKYVNRLMNTTCNSGCVGRLAEHVVHDVLVDKGYSPKKPKKMNGCIPDLETENFIYEILS